jgi:transposase
MAGKPKRMGQIKQLILLHQQGHGAKSIARELGMSKNTAKTYLKKIGALGATTQDLLQLDDPVLEARFHAGTPSYKQDRYEKIKLDLDHYLNELKETGVTRRLLWEEYRAQHSDGYGYTQFCHHLNQSMAAKKPSMVLNHLPGDKLFIDFAGKTHPYVDIQTGEIVQCQVFVACLPYSDYGFAMAVPSQCIQDFLYALECCLHNLGGVPQAIVCDNLKSAVTRADRYDPDVNTALEDFANHYQTAISPARVRKPQDKALVENQVRLVYNRVYARLRNMQFFDLPSLNKAFAQKVLEHNQTRMQQKDYCREEKFLCDEKHTLKPLPEERFELKSYKELKVAKNNHVYLGCDKHYYSVPFSYIGQKAKVIYTRSMVYIYVKGDRVAVHKRGYRKGAYTTCREHLCSQHQHYGDRSPDYYKRLARPRSELLLLVFTEMFSREGVYPELLYRSCDGLLNLQRRSDPKLFAAACQMALDYGNCNLRFIANIIANKMVIPSEPVREKHLPGHENIRGASSYR